MPRPDIQRINEIYASGKARTADDNDAALDAMIGAEPESFQGRLRKSMFAYNVLEEIFRAHVLAYADGGHDLSLAIKIAELMPRSCEIALITAIRMARCRLTRETQPEFDSWVKENHPDALADALA